MSDGIRIDIKGLSETKKVLESLATKDADAAIRKALRAGAAIEVAAIEERAPVKSEDVGGMLPAGALQADISFTIKRSDQGNLSAIVGPGKLTRHVANLVEYGHRLIHGGRSRLLTNGKTKGPGSHIGDVKPHPFIRPAFEATAEEVAQVIANTLMEEVSKAANK